MLSPVIGIVTGNLYCAFGILPDVKPGGHGSRERDSSKSVHWPPPGLTISLI